MIQLRHADPNPVVQGMTQLMDGLGTVRSHVWLYMLNEGPYFWKNSHVILIGSVPIVA